MIVQKLLWIWLHPYSTQVIHGVQVGGQVHIAFGNSAEQITQFFSLSSVKKEINEWTFRLEKYDNYEAQLISFSENPLENQRSGECRIPAQAPTSSMRYPLWKNSVDLLDSNQQPKQFIIFLRDKQDRFHARVLSIDRIQSQMPNALVNAILDSRNDSQAGIYEKKLVYEDSQIVTSSDAETSGRVKPLPRKGRRRRLDDFEEGDTQEIISEMTRRNPDLAREVKERDNYTCVVCEFNFFETYGEIGKNFAECHHLVPFSVLRGRRISTIDEAVTVCANCHRMLHRGNKLLTPDELRELLR